MMKNSIAFTCWLFGVVLATSTTTVAFQCSSIRLLSMKSQNDRLQTNLFMVKTNSNGNSDFMRFAKQSRSASATDNVVELMRPLGLVLNEDENGNVYVETVAPNSNAARTGMIREGDIVTMCSATFGDDMWSTRGVGLTRVLAAIRVRAGATVKLVVESPKNMARKQSETLKQIQAREAAAIAAQAKKDKLLSELEQDEIKLKKGKGFFGLF